MKRRGKRSSKNRAAVKEFLHEVNKDALITEYQRLKVLLQRNEQERKQRYANIVEQNSRIASLIHCERNVSGVNLLSANSGTSTSRSDTATDGLATLDEADTNVTTPNRGGHVLLPAGEQRNCWELPGEGAPKTTKRKNKGTSSRLATDETESCRQGNKENHRSSQRQLDASEANAEGIIAALYESGFGTKYVNYEKWCNSKCGGNKAPASQQDRRYQVFADIYYHPDVIHETGAENSNKRQKPQRRRHLKSVKENVSCIGDFGVGENISDPRSNLKLPPISKNKLHSSDLQDIRSRHHGDPCNAAVIPSNDEE